MKCKLPSFPAAVVFDLDGTLIDSAPDLHTALNRLLASDDRRALDLQEVILMIGDGVPKLVERGYQATGGIPDRSTLSHRIGQFTADYEQHATDLTVLFPGVREVLARLKKRNIPLGICTNKPQAATLQVLRHFELSDTFKAVVGGDQLAGVRKPDARHLLAALDILGVDPLHAVMVGDSPNDIYVAINAAVRSIAVSFGYTRIPVCELGAEQIIDHFDDLEQALSAINFAARP